MIKKILITAAAAFVIMLGAFAIRTNAEELNIDVETSDGYPTDILTDDDYFTLDYYREGTTVTIRADEPIAYLYIKWDTVPGAWKLTSGGNTRTYGSKGFLHELVKVDSPSNEVVMEIVVDRTYITDIYAFSEGALPDWVQDWEEPYEEADILFFSTHSDDEVLFFGGLIPNYTNGGKYRVQVAYFSNLWLTESYRNHELLDGIWCMGVRHYPQLGEFEDIYSESLEEAEGMYDHDEALEYVVRTIRRFKPQVMVAQDLNGEYGHGMHMLTAELTTEAIEIAGDESRYPQSASQYGTWSVPKTYLHLYSENPIEANARVPLDDFGGMTALEVATKAYTTCHLSQQWMWFYVSDGYDDDGNPNGYEYSCTKYGLYRSLVGSDTGNDIMEHITPYDEQKPDEPESTPEETETTPEGGDKDKSKNVDGWLKVLIIIVSILLVIFIVLLIWASIVRSKKKKLAEQRRIQRMQQRNRDSRK